MAAGDINLLNNTNFGGGQLKNALLQLLAADPSATTGQIWFNTVDDRGKLELSTGTQIIGEVFGPSSSTNNELALFSGTGGKTLKEGSGITIGTAGVITGTTANGDLSLQPNGTGNVILGTLTFDGDQTVGAGQDGFALIYNDATGLIELTAIAGGLADGDTLATGLTFPNTGLHILDTNATHDLILKPNSDLTADRTLSIVTGDSDRSITLNGDTTLSGTNTGDELDASTTVKGIIEIATQPEADAGLSSTLAITPDTLANYSKTHDQNTDTGTTATSFDVDSGGTGFKLKNNASEVQLRDLGDTAYVNLRVANLVVEGTTTTVESETVEIADNKILLNKDVTGAPTEDAGIEVERGTSPNVEVRWNETDDVWELFDGTNAHQIVRKYATDVGDGASTDISVTHNLGTEDIANVQIRYAAGSKESADVPWNITNTNTIELNFLTAPTSNQFRVVISA